MPVPSVFWEGDWGPVWGLVGRGEAGSGGTGHSWGPVAIKMEVPGGRCATNSTFGIVF